MSPLKSSNLFTDTWFDLVPAIQPGETLYSWCSVYHRVSGSASAKATSLRLFGSATGGFPADFPGRVDSLTDRTGHLLGDAVSIIRHHTLIQLYAKFRPPPLLIEIYGLMRGNNVGRVKFFLGLPSSRASSHHPLKFCRDCVAEEAKEVGIARWWISHQWPTALTCPRHHTLLCRPTAGLDVKHRTAFFLPSDLREHEIAQPVLTASQIEELIALGNLTQSLASSAEPSQYELKPLWLTFIKKAKSQGWISDSGAIRYGTMRDKLLTHYGWAATLPGLEFLASVLQRGFGFIGLSMQEPRRFLHPSKYVMMMQLLWGDFPSFVEEYFSIAESVKNNHANRVAIVHPARIARDSKLRRLIIEEHRSINQAAKILNISPNSVIAWAKRNNVEYSRRPRRETKELLLKLTELVAQGRARDEMAAALGVRRRLLTEVLSRHPTLRQTWIANHQLKSLERRRAVFLTRLAECSGIPVAKLPSVPGLGFRWLAKHDSEWLKQKLPVVASK